jgi:thermitase
MPTLRRAHTAAAVLLAIVVALGVPAVVHAAAQPRLIVGFRADTPAAAQLAGVARSGGRAKAAMPQVDAVVVQVAPGEVANVRARLLRRPDVAYVELDGVAHAFGLDEAAASGVVAQWHPNDTFLAQQWALGTLGAEHAWELSRGTGVTIAVVDTGVDYIHPDLKGRVDIGHDFVDNDEDPMDVQGHGTHVAGIAAAGADDGFGVAGIAPGARILAVRVLDADGAGNYSHVAKGIIYAAERGAKVINLSLGGDEQSELLRNAIDYASARGAIVTCATGNEGRTSIGFPARYDSCVAVGATDANDQRAHFSNSGQGIDVVAPGAQILSSTMGGLHEAWDGTSMATPYVSGAAALLVAQGLHRGEVIGALTSTAKDLGAPGPDLLYGAGRIDAAAAVDAASRMPRAAADTTAPTVSSIELLPVRRATTTTWSQRWTVRSRTPYRRVGSSSFLGAYGYSKTTVRGSTRTIQYFRFRRGVVYRSVVVQVKRRVPNRTTATVVPVRVTASDDVGVDRVSVEVDGRTRGVDWSAADGWIVEVPCSAGPATFTARAFDVADNGGDQGIRATVAC